MLFIGCVIAGAILSAVATSLVWSSRIEPNIQCTDPVGWAFNNLLTDMDSHKNAEDTISPGWTWEKLKVMRNIYLAAFFLIWTASSIIPFYMILHKFRRPNITPTPPDIGTPHLRNS